LNCDAQKREESGTKRRGRKKKDYREMRLVGNVLYIGIVNREGKAWTRGLDSAYISNPNKLDEKSEEKGEGHKK